MRPLENVRVLDLSRLLPGPFAAKVLGDLGAAIDRVDAPDAEIVFPSLHRGKRSIRLDLKAKGAPETFARLAGAYDVLLESFRPRVMDRLGIGHRALCDAHPRLIVCALSGYGQTGSRAGRAGHDLNYVARAGLLGLMGPEDQTPQVPGFQVADIGGALFAVIAILGALRERDRTGKGTVLDIALSEAALPFATAAIAEASAGAPAPRGAGVLTGGIAAYNTYATSDGGFVALAALEPKFLQRFCDAAGLAFDPSALVPGAHQAAHKRRLAAVFSTKTREEWSRFAEQQDCCLESVLEPSEWLTDAGPSFRSPVTPRDAPLGAVPSVGEDADAVLADAGFPVDEVAQLRAQGIVR